FTRRAWAGLIPPTERHIMPAEPLPRLRRLRGTVPARGRGRRALPVLAGAGPAARGPGGLPGAGPGRAFHPARPGLVRPRGGPGVTGSGRPAPAPAPGRPRPSALAAAPARRCWGGWRTGWSPAAAAERVGDGQVRGGRVGGGRSG